MSKISNLRDDIIAALPRHNEEGITGSAFMAKMGNPKTDDEIAIWTVLGQMERDGEVRWNDRTMQLTTKVVVQ